MKLKLKKTMKKIIYNYLHGGKTAPSTMLLGGEKKGKNEQTKISMATPQPWKNPHMGNSGNKRDREKENGKRPQF